MKFAISTIVLVAATLTQAIAIAEPNADADAKRRGNSMTGWCGARGMACAKDKRDAEADPRARRGNSMTGWCGARGSACARVKRSADAIADAFAVPEADPKRRGNSMTGWCGARGAPCAKARRDLIHVGTAVEDAITDIYVREADPDAEAKRRGNSITTWCGARGAPCGKVKRDAEAEAEPKKRKGNKHGFLGRAKPKRKGPKYRGNSITTWCGARGMGCGKVKRAAEAEADALAEAKRRGNSITTWCGARGSACGKFKRDEPETEEVLKREICEAEDGECTALRNALMAFQEIKRSDEILEAENLASIDEDDEVSKREAEACSAPGGECDLAKRSLDEIEARLTAAVEAL
jgi:hypothetical protein